MINSLLKYCFVLFATVAINSCNSANQKPLDTPTSGEIKIAVDESFQPLLNQVIDTFQALYKYAKIDAQYEPETDMINDFMNDSVKVIITCKELNDEQLQFIKAKNILLRKTRIAVDAIALIINNENKDSLLKISNLRDILIGSITNWKQLTKENNAGEIQVVFDNAGSSNARYLKEKFLGNKDFPANCSAVKTNAEVINYVNANKNAIGVIAVNYVSDSDDPSAMSFLQKIKVVALRDDVNSKDEEYYQPYQAYISLNNYPLTREVYVMNRESRTGLGTGFASFIAGDQGQRIIRLSGLLPATMPVRLIQLAK